jgi:hypothetical protein
MRKINWIINRNKKRKYYFLFLCTCILEVIHIHLDTTLNERSCKKEKRDRLKMSRFCANYIFLHSWRSFFLCNITILLYSMCLFLYSLDENRLDVRSRNDSIMVFLWFFSRHLTKKKRKKNEMQDCQLFPYISLSLSLVFCLIYYQSSIRSSWLLLHICQKATTTSRNCLFVFLISYVYIYCIVILRFFWFILQLFVVCI